MGLAVAFSRAQLGIEAPLVQVEVHTGVGLPSFNIVGLAETVVRESRDRVRSAIEHSGFDFPSGRVIVNLAPADLPKSGGRYDLPRALDVAAAGSHSLLFVGAPGTGKSMLAQRLPGILPPMTETEALEAAAVLSIVGRPIIPALWRRRPFRAPHHTASAPALVGGGPDPRPGEISLAHHGVLFLDELPEFSRHVLEVLREPLESGRITISRAASQADFPARFQFIAAMNPCPCGYLGHYSGRCRCTPDRIAQYRGRGSGPLLDRLDLHVEVPRVDTSHWRQRGVLGWLP